jgi:hypothetical protein
MVDRGSISSVLHRGVSNVTRTKATALSVITVLAFVLAPLAPASAGVPRHWAGGHAGFHGLHEFGLGGLAVGAVVGLLTLPLALAEAAASYDSPGNGQDYGPQAYAAPPPVYYAPPPAYYAPAPAYYAPPAYYGPPAVHYRPSPGYYGSYGGYAGRSGYAAAPRYNNYSGYRAARHSGYYNERR